MILTVENLTKSYGEKVLFQNINFSVDKGDKVGIVGVNGTGKSTFMAALAGKIPVDEGHFLSAKNLTIEYLSQNKEFEPENTVLQEVFKGDSLLMKTLYEYELLLSDEKQLANNTERLGQLSARIDELNGWDMEARAKTILNKLGLVDLNKQIKQLSGGQLKRLALATTLIKPCDLLLLDEPTNHLDVNSIIWLEEYLAGLKCAIVLVTHDRYFLDKVSNKILELDKGAAYVYTGNYTEFLKLKVERIEREKASEAKRQNFLRNELKWVQRGALARSTKQKARLQRFEDVKNQHYEERNDKIQLGFQGSRLGRTVIAADEVSYAIEGKTIIKDFTYTFTKKDRIAIVGANGSGKTTMLNLLAGELQPTSGSLVIGQTVKIGYFKQHNTFEDENMKAIEYIKEIAAYLKLADGTLISASQLMERFLFNKDLQWNPIAKLSGGEKRRLYLLGILMGAPNLLLLDEPTNDLDIDTLAVLEEFIDNFHGAVVLVSHDRFFVDRLANKLFVYQPGGELVQYIGGYTEYANTIAEEQSQFPKEMVNKKAATPKKEVEKPKKLSFKEQKEYEEIEDVINDVENNLKFIQKQMEMYANDFTKLNDLAKEEEAAQAKLEELMDRWAYLEELANNE